ncbi:MAG: hypothetical protein AAFU50_09505 [Pseudomonadota bacterium]
MGIERLEAASRAAGYVMAYDDTNFRAEPDLSAIPLAAPEIFPSQLQAAVPVLPRVLKRRRPFKTSVSRNWIAHVVFPVNAYLRKLPV